MPDNSWMPEWLRALFGAATGNSAPNQQPGAEEQTDDEQDAQDIDDRTSDSPEDKADEDGESQTSADDVSDNEDDANTSSNDNGGLGHAKKFIGVMYSSFTDKVTSFARQARDAVADAIDTVKQLGFIGTAKAIGQWIKLHPWETALIVVPLVALICTAIALSATGFGSAGIVAGSTAAIIHAGIGNVVAGSIFATCTSAMMGGYGAVIVFGGVWIGSTALMTILAAAWKSWKNQSQRALVLRGTTTPKSSSDIAKQAASDAVFWTMVAAAYAVYRFKSWYRGNT